ncbi:MAG: hypothetical protein DWP98_02040 [Bacteroidetes bacterium]|nr:MAG: hypothetical protein DWP98_02040 [Bacteroidota bacterium]MBL1145525.1 hypothetical protein [Bacteroidota bacterium]NOG58322.1 oligosaccharide flippase family protein [Bacteroidota bacterium]
MQKKFIGNLLFVLFLNILVKPFWIIGIDVAVQNRVGAEEYGLYYPIFGFSILFNIILDFGITNYNNRNIAQHSHMLRRYFSGIFNVKLILGLIYLVVTLVVGYVIGYRAEQMSLLILLCINQFLVSLVLYLRSNIAGLHLFKMDGFLSIIDRVLMILICSVLLWNSYFEGRFSIKWFVYAQTASYLITAFVAFIIVFKKAKFYRLKIDIKMFRLILKQSLPFALLVLLMSFYYRLDSVMIDLLLIEGRYEAGVYAQAYRLLEGFNMFGFIFAGILLPMFAKMIKNQLPIDSLVRTSFNLIFIPTIIVAIISYCYGKEIMELLYVANVSESAKVYSILMFSFVAIASTYVYGTLLTANGSLKALNIISGIGLVVNFVLNYWLIPIYAAYGAAIATLITQIIVIFSQIYVTKKTLDIPLSKALTAKYLGILTIGVLVTYLIFIMGNNWIINSLIIGLVFILLSFLFGLFKWEEIRKLIAI